MAEGKATRKGGDQNRRYRLNLVGFKTGDERPEVAVRGVDTAGKAFFESEVKADGSFDLPAEVLKKAHRIVVGPSNEEASAKALHYRPVQLAQLLESGQVNIGARIWGKWFWVTYCVSGSVEVCRRRPWWFEDLFQLAAAPLLQTKTIQKKAMFTRDVASSSQARYIHTIPEVIAWPYRCETVCYGSVEVYRRTCCCRPWVIDDPRIPDLIRELEDIVRQLPEKFPPIKFPPPPPPPPPDWMQMPFFKNGALDEKAVYAAHDLQVIRSLPRQEIAAYINARPHLHCLRTCSAASKVAQGTINPDGTFNICWSEFPRRFSLNCHDEYAYVVKQTIGGTTTTIYDGVAANIWFHLDDDANLVSYHPAAFSCRETGHPDGQAYVYLDLIGDTESWQLKTPNATGWDRVAAPAFNDGLMFPLGDSNGVANRNLGGGVALTFNFSEGMKQAAVGAYYYRVSVTEADSNGNPVGSREYFSDGLSWQKAIVTISGVDIVPENLGPTSQGGNDFLYKIPYDSDADWTGAGRHHAVIDTALARFNNPADPNVRHLITLEVFDSAGTRLRPVGTGPTGQSGSEVARPFKYRRWFQAGGSPGDDTVEVPQAALTHMFWWDNRPPVAVLEALVFDGSDFNEECLLLEGTPSSTFGIKYRAYVANQLFQRYHTIWWGRGLYSIYGGTGSLLPSSSLNVGDPPNPAGLSPTNTFAQMLDTASDPTRLKCSFVVNLTTYAKTTNGADLNYPHDDVSGAFALEIGS